MTACALVISKARAQPRYAALFAELKDLSTGHGAVRLFGVRHAEILAALFCHSDTLQSHTRSFFAATGGRVVGLITCIPATEFAIRRRTTMTEIRRLSAGAAARVRFFDMLRRLRRTRLGPSAPTQLHIASLAVCPQARRRGVASALVAHASQQAAAAGHRQLSLDVAAANHPAIAFYRACGFGVAAARRGNLKLTRAVGVPTP